MLWARMTRPHLLAILTGLLLLAAIGTACGETVSIDAPAAAGAGGPDDKVPIASPIAAESGLPCDVAKVLGDRCTSCHGAQPTFGAPMALTSYDALVAPAPSDKAKKVYERVGARIHDDARPMPQPPNPRLSVAEMAVLDGWIAKGAPKSDGTCFVATPDGGAKPTLDCSPDMKLQATKPWTMPTATTNEYVCYGMDIAAATDRHIVTIAPRIDNPKIVHHVLLFQTDSAYPTVPQKCNAGGGLGWRMMFGWAPGGKPITLPKEAGFPLKKGQPNHYVVQVHYNNISALVGETDTSGFDLCTSTPRQYEADVAAFGTQAIKIQPRSTLDKTCSYTVGSSNFDGRHLIAAMPHMHDIGTLIDTQLVRPGGGPEVSLGTVPNWDFDTQLWYPLDVTLKSGDVIRTRCAWDNKGDTVVNFGEKTEDEMCYSFTLYYPKINTLLWSFVLPAATSSCK